MSDNIRFVLASASPRRHELLCTVGIPHDVLVTDADEIPAGSPSDCELYAAWFAREVSRLKGDAAVSALLESGAYARTFVISADTVVSSDGCEIFGKPKDADDAVRMLTALSGRSHYVAGGITVFEINCGKVVHSASRSVVTKVTFKELSRDEISVYVASGEPDGKAGAYAIQGLGGVFVTSIEGDYPNVVGISTAVLCDVLDREFSVKLTEKPRSMIKF